jgi:hypothetical protein
MWDTPFFLRAEGVSASSRRYYDKWTLFPFTAVWKVAIDMSVRDCWQNGWQRDALCRESFTIVQSRPAGCLRL